MKRSIFRHTIRHRQLFCILFLVATIILTTVLIQNKFKSNNTDDKDYKEVILQVTDDFLQENLSDPSLTKDNLFIYKSYGNKSCAIIGVIDKSISIAEICAKSPRGDVVVEIGSNAFSGCDRLVTITISEAIKKIASDAFIECSNLTHIRTNSSNTKFCSIDGVLMNKDKTELLCYPSNKKDKCYLLGSGINRVGSYAFYGVKNLELLLYEGSSERFGKIYVALGNECLEKMPITCNYVVK